MLKNYFKIAWRTLWKSKIFSVINILGLAIGISASLVIYLIASYNLSFDKFEKDNKRIYRLVWTMVAAGEKYYVTGITYEIPSAIKKEITGLDAVVPFGIFNSNPKISVPVANATDPVAFKNQNGFVYADENYFNLIGYNWLADSAKTSLHISSLLRWATGLAVLISSLGLLGLVMYITTQRAKEIGVRKVLGATVSQLVTLLSKDFVRLVLIALVIATPLAWLGMNQWQQSFAYRTAISWWIFVGAGLLMIAVAFITLSFQTIKTAVANPVKSLRTE